MATTSLLSLPLILGSQAQKHVTHNEALQRLDAIIQLSVKSAVASVPPASPAEGERYIVGALPTGAFYGHANELACFQNGTFTFLVPRIGWQCWDEASTCFLLFDGESWVDTSLGGSAESRPHLGINATADAVNRLTVASEASLFTHAGANHRLKLNKAGTAQSASILFQTDFSSRGEIGLVGEDDLAFKVSNDGTVFRDAIRIDRATGSVAFPHTLDLGVNQIINGDFAINQRGFSGGALTAGLYGYDRWKAGSPGATISVTNGITMLAAGAIIQVIEAPRLAGRSVTVSVEDLVGGNLAVDVAGQTGVITAKEGRTAVTLTVPSSVTGNIAVSLAPASASVMFRRVKLENGQNASAWTTRPAPVELMLCQRYYERLSGSGGERHIRRGTASLTGVHTHWIQFIELKRATPTPTLLTPQYSEASNAYFGNPSVYGMELYFNVIAAGGSMLFGYSADAEL